MISGMRKIQLISFLLCLSFSGILLADTDDHDSIITILQSISLKPGDEVAFIETKTFDLLEFPIVSKGVLTMSHGDILTKYLIDENESLIISETELRKIHNDHETVIVYSDHPKARQLGLIIRALLMEDISTLEDYFHFDLKRQEQRWTIRFIPIKKPLSELIRFIELKGEGAHLDKTEILKDNGDIIITSFQDNSE